MINETKFTEGEWSVEYGNIVVISDDRFEFEHEFENKHDAHLIAAAPEMYKMIERLKVECEMYNSEFGDPSSGEFEAAFTEVEDLLAAARGVL